MEKLCSVYLFFATGSFTDMGENGFHCKHQQREKGKCNTHNKKRQIKAAANNGNCGNYKAKGGYACKICNVARTENII